MSVSKIVYFDSGPNKGRSKGLREIAKELGYDLEGKKKLDDIKKILVDHPTFKPTNKLEILRTKYGIKVIFLPKYHCELNPIEG